MLSQYKRPLMKLGIAIVIFLVLGVLFSSLSETVLSEEQQDEVLFMALPFVLIFVAIILAFITLIVIIAILFNGKLPQRLYRPIEMLTIAGILLGIFGLFQPWKLFSYQYGFLLLLVSTLWFIVWSHVTPRQARTTTGLPPITRRAQIGGLVAGVVAWIAIAVVIGFAVKPEAPYGQNQRLWDMMDEAEREPIADAALDEYRRENVPLIVLISLLPAAAFFFVAREAVAGTYRSLPPAEPSDSVGGPPEGVGVTIG